ncbi:hypothetical protein ATO12_25075 [Aquimarina atlantica]|uniref:Uncharacterized protein n=1 Tax=Aquimarina atlantica TaxID=1317122 RepID=A0A023BQK5_9FLAO|nr:hypothetical protein ATO12_25075 [Aquimarina atlantica]
MLGYVTKSVETNFFLLQICLQKIKGQSVKLNELMHKIPPVFSEKKLDNLKIFIKIRAGKV